MYVKVQIEDAYGSQSEIEAPPGRSLMQTAKTHGIEGIVAECGGNAMCATCHVYVDEAWQDRLPERDLVEDEMLEYTTCERTAGSRLSCQIILTPDLDGLKVRLPESQV